MEWSKATNEQIRLVAARFGGAPREKYDFLCECGCRKMVAVTLRKFDALRRDGKPLVLPDHADRYPAERARALRQEARFRRQEVSKTRQQAPPRAGGG